MQVDKPVCPVYMVTWIQVDKPVCPVYLQIIKDLVWKSSYNGAIAEQGIKFSWSAGVRVWVVVTTQENRESDLGLHSSSYGKPFVSKLSIQKCVVYVFRMDSIMLKIESIVLRIDSIVVD